MAIEINCQSCGATLRAPENASGKRVRCPGCQVMNKIPGAQLPSSDWDDGATAAIAEKPAPPPPPPPSRPSKPAPSAAPPKKSEASAFSPVAVVDPPAAPPTQVIDPLQSLPQELQIAAQSELASGETLVWAGRPSKRVSLFRTLQPVSSACLYSGLLFFAGGAAFWAFGKNPLPPLAALLGGIFVLVAIVRALSQRGFADRTLYLLTSRRAIVATVKKGRTEDVMSFPASTAANLQRVDSKYFPNGGDVVFERIEKPGGFTKKGKPRPPIIELRGFLHVEPVREIEKLVRDTLHEPGKPTRPDTTAVTVAAREAGAKGGGTLAMGYLAVSLLCFGPAMMGLILGASGGGVAQLGNPFSELSDGDGPSPQRKQVLEDLKSTDAKKRLEAVQKIEKADPDPKKTKDPQVLSAAIAPLISDPDPKVAEAAAKALEKWATPVEASAVATGLTAESKNVRESSIKAAQRIAKEAKTPEEKKTLAPLAPGLVKLLGKPDAAKAKEILKILGSHAEPALTEALKDPDNKVRQAARELLGPPSAASLKKQLEDLHKGLDDPDPKVKIAACQQLEEVGTADSLLYLGNLAGDPDPAVKEAADKAFKAIKARTGR